MRPETEDGRPLSSGEGAVDYVRTGLLGFLGPGGLVFVCGSRDGLMTVRITEKYLLTPEKYLTHEPFAGERPQAQHGRHHRDGAGGGAHALHLPRPHRRVQRQGEL